MKRLFDNALSVIMSIRTPAQMSKMGEFRKRNAADISAGAKELFEMAFTNWATSYSDSISLQPNSFFWL